MVSMLQLGIFLTMSMSHALSLLDPDMVNYMFYAPRYFTPEDGLNITVILYKNYGSMNVTVTLKDGDKDLKTISQQTHESQQAVFMKMNTEGLAIKRYKLHINFGAELEVNCGYNSMRYILTDKNVYKPGDTVKFRVLNLFRNYTGRNDPMKAYIRDANKNLLSEMQLTAENGVSANEFQISSRPVLGKWTIEVEQDEFSEKKSIKVKEYVLPKVEVTVKVPKHIFHLNKKSFKGRILTVTVKARYTQGKPVSGTAKLYIRENCLRNNSFSQKIKGETTFNIDLGTVAIFGSRCGNFKINASVVNDLDKKVYYADLATTSLTDSPIEVVSGNSDYLYKQNTMLKYKLYVKRVDGQPLTDEDRKDTLKISIDDVDFSYNTSSEIPENGIVEFAFTPPNRRSLRARVIFSGEYEAEKYLMLRTVYLSYRYPRGGHILTRMDDETSKPEFLLTFPHRVTSFFFTVVSCSRVFISKHVKQDAAKSATISFDTSGMIRKAHIVVGYGLEERQIETSSVTIDVKGPTSVSLNATFKESLVKPGHEAELVIQSNPNTTAFVAAVDKSVLLLSKKTDSISEMIFNRMIHKEIYHSYSSWEYEFYQLGIAVYADENIVYEMMVAENFKPRGKKAKAPKLRTNFQETWIWDTIDTGSTGMASLAKTAPDTITTWVTTLFGMHPSEGFIPYNQEVELTTFQDFYISLGIPYSIVRGELFELNVYVFNYISKNETVTVQLMNSNKTVKEEKTINMTADQTEVAVAFRMEPNEIGKVPVMVYASISNHTDAVQRYLNVIAEGSTHEMSQPLSVNVSLEEPFTELVEIKYPPKVVEGSEVVSVSVICDIMGPVLSGLDQLIRFPTGCGEQTMLSLYPNVLVFMYLEARDRLSPSTSLQLEKNTIGGYQNELTYQHKDGSFSAFGDRDESGSTWLTAYVIKCFCKAKHQMKGVTIDSKVIEKAVSWLLERQQKDGSFKEVGNVIHKNMQGGTSSGVTLTAFVTISLLQCQEVNAVNVTNSLKGTAEYLRSWVNNKRAKDAYSLSVVLTAFALLKDGGYFNRVNKQLLSLATKKDDKMYWASSPSKSVEMAAYALLAYSYKHKMEESIPVRNYLVSQRNSHGGFRSTQDTVMGLEALTQYALLFSQNDSAVDVTIETNEGTEYSFETITYENSTILYKKDLPSSTKNLKVEVTGNGYVLVQVNWQYNLIPEEKGTYLSINMSKKSTPPETAEYDTCVKYTGKDDTGMVLVSINTLSGFTANSVDQSSDPLIKRSEVEDNKVVVYLDSLPNGKESCFPVKMDLDFNVENMKPQVAEVLMYYQPDQKAETTYSISDPITARVNRSLPLRPPEPRLPLPEIIIPS
ncbi:containing II, isoform E [Octopus vulgaris]|nr:containing II, isoform E [Octopus vulgaris]